MTIMKFNFTNLQKCQHHKTETWQSKSPAAGLQGVTKQFRVNSVLSEPLTGEDAMRRVMLEG